MAPYRLPEIRSVACCIERLEVLRIDREVLTGLGTGTASNLLEGLWCFRARVQPSRAIITGPPVFK